MMSGTGKSSGATQVLVPLTHFFRDKLLTILSPLSPFFFLLSFSYLYIRSSCVLSPIPSLVVSHDGWGVVSRFSPSVFVTFTDLVAAKLVNVHTIYRRLDCLHLLAHFLTPYSHTIASYP